MKSSLIALTLLAVLICVGCSSSPKLAGISFSKVEVIGPESGLVNDLVRNYLVQQGAQLEVEKAPTLVIHTHVELRRDGRTESVLLMAETSTGVVASGGENCGHIGSSNLQDLASMSAWNLVNSLGNKVKKTKSESANL